MTIVKVIGSGDACCEFQPLDARDGQATRGGTRHVRIGLVACTKRKQPCPCAARQMYSPSALFRKASAYCAREYDTWYILSAKYGLLAPDEVIEPYDKTLKTMSKAERKAWGRKVSNQLLQLGDHQYFAHAGLAYLKPLSGMNIVNVLTGLRMGKRLQWYDDKLAGVEDTASTMPAIDKSLWPESELTVERVAFSARWYRQNTRFDESYMRLLSMDSFLHKLRTRPDDLTGQDVLNKLIIGFLNPWGCHVPRKVETARAIRQSLARVAHGSTALAHRSLLDCDLSYGVAAIGGPMARSYEELRAVERVGPTVASKILHVLNPALFVMWDAAIRKHFSSVLGRNLDTGADYVAFLAHMQELAKSVVRDFSLRHEHTLAVELYLSEQLGLDAPVTLAKFLDEYNWVTIVRRVRFT